MSLIVRVRFFTILREIVGKREETLSFQSGEKVDVNVVLHYLVCRYGRSFEDYVFDSRTGKVKGFLQLLVNGRSLTNVNDLKTELQDGDVLAIVPPVGGG
jgi:sulfur-carrier protein